MSIIVRACWQSLPDLTLLVSRKGLADDNLLSFIINCHKNAISQLMLKSTDNLFLTTIFQTDF